MTDLPKITFDLRDPHTTVGQAYTASWRDGDDRFHVWISKDGYLSMATHRWRMDGVKEHHRQLHTFARSRLDVVTEIKRQIKEGALAVAFTDYHRKQAEELAAENADLEARERAELKRLIEKYGVPE